MALKWIINVHIPDYWKPYRSLRVYEHSWPGHENEATWLVTYPVSCLWVIGDKEL